MGKFSRDASNKNTKYRTPNLSILAKCFISFFISIPIPYASNSFAEDNRISVEYFDQFKKKNLKSIKYLITPDPECGKYSFIGEIKEIERKNGSLTVSVVSELGFQRSISIGHPQISSAVMKDIGDLIYKGGYIKISGEICGAGRFFYESSIEYINKKTKPEISYYSTTDLIFNAKNSIGKNILLDGKFKEIGLRDEIPNITLKSKLNNQLSYWTIELSEDFFTWSQYLEENEEISILCKITKVSEFGSHCKIIRLANGLR